MRVWQLRERVFAPLAAMLLQRAVVGRVHLELFEEILRESSQRSHTNEQSVHHSQRDVSQVAARQSNEHSFRVSLQSGERDLGTIAADERLRRGDLARVDSLVHFASLDVAGREQRRTRKFQMGIFREYLFKSKAKPQAVVYSQ